MGSWRVGVLACALVTAMGCSVERIDLMVRDAAVDAGAPALSCRELGNFQGSLPAARRDENAPRVFFGEESVLGRGSGIRTGESVAMVADQLWWGEGYDGCRDNSWGLRMWRVPLDPDLRRTAAPRCEPQSRRGALIPNVAWNGSFLAVCYDTHAEVIGMREGRPVYGDYRLECGRISTAQGPGSWSPTMAARPGLFHQLGVRASATLPTPVASVPAEFALGYQTEDGTTWMQRLDGNALPRGEATPLPVVRRSVRAVSFFGDAWWVLRARQNENYLSDPSLDIVRVNAEGAVLGTIPVPASLSPEVLVHQVRAVPAYGGLAMLTRASPVPEGEEQTVNYLFACGEQVVARRPVYRGALSGTVAWVAIDRGWLVLLPLAAPTGGVTRLGAIVLDPRGVQLGAMTTVDEGGPIDGVSAVRGTGPDDVWVLYRSVSGTDEITTKLRSVRVY